MNTVCNQSHQLEIDFEEIAHHERRTLLVVLLTTVMMIVEIAAGYVTGSMALLADGYHMASHAGALGVAYLVYRLARSPRLKTKFTFGSGKFLPLGGYTSAIGLGIIAVWMAFESIHRFFNPVSIQFNEAIGIAVVGLAVNVVSALILGVGHHHHDHDHDHEHEDHDHVHDHNHESALVHVIADALTSVLAIIALIVGKFYSANWLDPAMGIVGSLVILKWAYSLCKNTAWELLDGHAKEVSLTSVQNEIAATGAKVVDFHFWKVGPGNFAGQLVVETSSLKGGEFYRQALLNKWKSVHLVVEERLI